MAELIEVVLGHLDKTGNLNSLQLADLLNEDHQKVVGAVKSLQSLGEVIRTEQKSVKQWELTDEGNEVVDKGSREAIVFKAVPKQGISQAELMKLVPNAKIGFSKAMSSGWICIDKSIASGPLVLRKVESIEDDVQQNLIKIMKGVENDIPETLKQEYKKRKLLQEVIIKSIDISKGPEFSTSVNKLETDLTPEMLASGSWKEKKFKSYNFDAMGIPPTRGHLHPLMRMRAQFRQIFLEMGFSEMPTDNFIESSFWNFDALFVPQKHPARDAQDTFFVADPKTAKSFPKEYAERVKKVHQDGAYGSEGYKCEWKLEEAQKNVLRTHTTSNSARMLYMLAQQEKFTPVKYFSIDRVFRNETLDATHLAEFFQIEGLIADYGLSLGNLIGVLNEFYKKLGITQLRFKPTYNPYTEPSMEVFSYHKGLKKWVEVGNSGMFRPELVLPTGLDENVTVIAWGLSLERPTMIKFGIDNIRDLEGHKVNLQMVYDAPICRLDKDESTGHESVGDEALKCLEHRQENILTRLKIVQQTLEDLTERLKTGTVSKHVLSKDARAFQPTPKYIRPADAAMEKDIVIHVSAKHFPFSVAVLCKMLGKQRTITILSHFHSSLFHIPNNTKCMSNGSNLIEFSSKSSSHEGTMKVTLIWHGAIEDVRMLVSPVHQWPINGEVNIARYLARHLEPSYEKDPITATCIDEWLDRLHTDVLHGTPKECAAFLKRLETNFKSASYLVGSALSLADIVVWSSLQKMPNVKLPLKVREWVNNLSRLDDFNVVSQIIVSDD